MDILSDLLREAGLRRRLLDVRAVPSEAALRFPCDRSIGFHVVLAGTVYVHAAGEAQPIRLDAGDIAVMGRGCHHLVCTRDDVSGLAVLDLTRGPGAPSASADTQMVSGAYQLWETPLHPFFAELPAWHVVRAQRAAALGPLQLCVSMLAGEMRADELGRDTVVQGLFDVLFAHLLRDIVRERAAEHAGFSQAVRDPQVRRAVALMHEDCARSWTLEALARAVGMSRSVLAERFRAAMHDTPLAYLRTVRLQRAMRLLSDGDATLEQLALQVGYRDAFAFSKAFKRALGVTPGEYRKTSAREAQAPYRFPVSEGIGTI